MTKLEKKISKFFENNGVFPVLICFIKFSLLPLGALSQTLPTLESNAPQKRDDFVLLLNEYIKIAKKLLEELEDLNNV